MPTRNAAVYLDDIVQCGQAIESYLQGTTLNDYQNDRKTRRAVERELMILTEAVVRLKADAETLLPGIDYLKARGLGNFIRHEYQNVEDHRIWETIHSELPRLIATAKESFGRLTASPPDPLP